MKQSVCLLLLLKLIITIDCTTRIGSINSAAYIPTEFTNVSVYKGTYSECLCFAFLSNNSSTYAALNYYINNKTCLLFRSFLSGSYIQVDASSKLAFLRLPNKTTVHEATTLTSSSISTALTSVDPNRYSATSSTYWGCCKPSCGWPGKASVTSPVKTCAKDGYTVVNNNNASVCGGGSAFICNNQQPWNVSNSLSYGYVGAGLTGKNESDWCCACYSLLFTSGPIIDKEMIVQAVDTSHPFNNTFVLLIPGGGWGTGFNACLNQSNNSYSWGQPIGGIGNRSACANLPSVLQAGCYWRFDWFMDADNPTVSYKEVPCPSNLTSTTGCVRTSNATN